VDPSHVLLAIGVSPALAKGSLRFSFGRASVPGDVQAVLEVFERIVAQARKVAA
jgi:cysteine desulfurase